MAQIPKAKLEIIVIRHGKTKLNADNKISVDRERGWSDVPLTAEGRASAEDTGEKLKKEGIQAMASSDLKRANETAHIVGRKIGIRNFKSTMEFRPWDLGSLTGQSTEGNKPKLKYYAENPDKKVPEGESFNAFKKRLFTGLRKFIDENPGKQIAIVTHHRVERLLKSWDKKGQPSDLSIDIPEFLKDGEPPAGVDKIKIDPRAFGAMSDGAVKQQLKNAMYGSDSLQNKEVKQLMSV